MTQMQRQQELVKQQQAALLAEQQRQQALILQQQQQQQALLMQQQQQHQAMLQAQQRQYAAAAAGAGQPAYPASVYTGIPLPPSNTQTRAAAPGGYTYNAAPTAAPTSYTMAHPHAAAPSHAGAIAYTTAGQPVLPYNPAAYSIPSGASAGGSPFGAVPAPTSTAGTPQAYVYAVPPVNAKPASKNPFD